MLRFLAIRRLAVIDSVQVEFGPGLNVLSGETGAGKSILVEAVGLLLGGRASGDLVRTGEETATVEAVFEIGDDEWLVRREITAQGRSRAFVNGDLATAGALKELSSRLIELHGQHEHQTLLDSSVHLTVLDAFARLEAARASVGEAYRALESATQELARLRKAAAERGTRTELVSFQLQELERAALRVGEDDELAALKHVLSNAERIERLCQESYDLLYESDGAALANLGHVWRKVSELAGLDPVFRPYLEARDAIKSQLEDLAGQLRSYAETLETSPARLQQVDDRLALLERLKRKHGPTLGNVIARRDTLKRELAELEQSSDLVAAQHATRHEAAVEYLRVASSLSDARRKAARDFSRSLEKLLADLAMERTRFEVRFAPPLPEAEWTETGIDQGEFYLSANLGEELRPLARIVSGGELSRVMLALKTLTATSKFGLSPAAGRAPGASAPGLVFDEVDAGIGGRVADVVGARLRALGSAFQVLCITHLPQIAAYADSHFLIEKHVDRGRTRTTVRDLDQEGRVEELARMLGGANVTPQVRASALEMLQQRRGQTAAKAKGETTTKGESESRPGASSAERRRRRAEA
jgi:DNA repair protein RecN (Recombination protein N)